MTSTEITIPIGESVKLKGDLNVPENPRALVIFSHGSGSSRLSTRNRYVAEILNKEKFATLLTDLLTEEEDQVYENRFNIELITKRLIGVTLHVRQMPQLQDLSIGYFGASTGAASALNAAAELETSVHAVVSRGGRPDLAARSLNKVKAPTLLIIGSLDTEVIKLNTQALNLMNCEKRIEIVEGAAHLFEEPGKLTDVARLAGGWFAKHLSQHTAAHTNNNGK
jgi:putative phosphoribosyl transferase